MPGKLPEPASPEGSEIVAATLNKSYSELGLSLPLGFQRLLDPERLITTTGHQLTLFGGAAFLHYKTITTIAAAKRLEAETGKPVVPVFWLASEDHDFDEVKSVWGGSKKHIWQHSDSLSKFPVGAMSLGGIREVFEDWVGDMPAYPEMGDFEEMRKSILDSVGRGESYAQLFTRWMHGWYGDYGLVVLDGSDPALKELASGLFAAELKGEGVALDVKQNAPAFVRDVNLFYSPPDSPRVGIIKTSDGQMMAGEVVLNSEGENWENWCDSNAADLSPSVLLRPLYQELLLSNAAVVVGPGEMGYWKQLSSALDLPTLILRNHTLVLDAKTGSVAEEMGWDLRKGWWTEDDFIRAFVDGVLQKDHETSLALIKSNPEHAYRTLKSLGVEDYALLDALCESGPRLRKASKTAVKKIRQSIKASYSDRVDEISGAAQSLFKLGSPQDRWANLHALSSRFGGFNNLVGKLVENSYSNGGVMQVVEEEF
jgi:hypothetical protein